MPLVIPGSTQIGPHAAAPPATLVDYLVSIGKSSWYGRFLASSGLAPNSDGSGGAVADGGAVGCWAAIQAASFSAKFTQATSASRPAYGASRDGKAGIYGNGSSWFMSLDSTTALNGSFSLLFSGWFVNESASVVSQNSLNLALRTASNIADQIYVTGVQAISAQQSWQRGLSGANNHVRGGFTTTGTGHNGNSMNLLRRSTASEYSTSTLYEIAMCPALTHEELSRAISYLV